MKKAPKKLSTAMRMALNDLRKVEKDPRYEVNMAVWHQPYCSEKGSVCLAGAVMAKSCGADPTNALGITAFGPDWARVFLALDWVRRGEVREAFRNLDKPTGKLDVVGLGDRISVIQYSANRKQWRKDMFKIVHKLERIGE